MDWKQKIKDFGFEIIDSCKDLDKDNTLFVTYCCAQKCDKQRAKVKDMISEKYGLVLLNQEIDNYDFGPKDLTEPIKEELRQRLRDQIKLHGKDNLVLFGAPLMSMGFMNLLSKVECNKYLCYGTNRLKEVPENKNNVKITLKNKKLF